MELVEEITAFVDNELNDYPIKCRMEELIGFDFVIQQEYLIQKNVTDLLRKRFACCAKSNHLRERIRERIRQSKIN